MFRAGIQVQSGKACLEVQHPGTARLGHLTLIVVARRTLGGFEQLFDCLSDHKLL